MRFFILILCLLCSSCQQTQPQKHVQSNEALKDTLSSTSSEHTPPKLPASITNELLEEDIGQPSATAIEHIKRFNIAAKNVSVRDFFQSLIQDMDMSVIIHPRVKGRISLALKKVSFQEVLNLVEEMYGYDIQRQGQIVRIFPAGLKTKTFPVNYLYIKRSGTSNTHVNNSERSIAQSNEQKTNEKSNIQGGTSVSSEVNNDFWHELKNNLESIIGTGQDRKVVLSPQASLVTVRAYPSELRQVEQFLNEAIAHLKRQVIIEAKIIEVQLNDSYSQGVQWSYILGANDNNNNANFQFGKAPDVNGGFTFNIKKAFNNSKDTFSAVVNLLETQGDVDVLSSPRITTSNNQKAVIKVGEDKTFTEGLSSVVMTDKDDPITQNIKTNVYFSGISLDVTPQINAQGEIILHVHPSIVEVESDPITINAQGGSIKFETAKSKIRESDTIIKAESGDVIIIGGLMQTKQTENVEKVPFLGDIPFLGKLFTYTSTSTQKTELVILLKPEVINENTWKKSLERSKELLKKWERD
tara:strand:- start:1496 stop:3073 length:1578 start_codon:yes stop_codon:yes gene_type:complete